MASNRVWNLMYVAGNAGRVVSDAANPQDRASALAGAATVEGNGRRVWVEHKDTGKRIFEKGAYQREDGIKPGDEVILVRGSRGRGRPWHTLIPPLSANLHPFQPIVRRHIGGTDRIGS